jgi:hypothetical protein
MPLRDRAKRFYDRAKGHIHQTSHDHTPEPSSVAATGESETGDNHNRPSSSSLAHFLRETVISAGLVTSTATTTLPTPSVSTSTGSVDATTSQPSQSNRVSLSGSHNQSTAIIPPQTTGATTVVPSKQSLPSTIPHTTTQTPRSKLQDFTSASPPSAKASQDVTKVAWSGLKTIGQVLKSSASTFGPLKTAVEGIDGCVEIFEVHMLITGSLRLTDIRS